MAFLGSTGQIFFFAFSFHILNSFWIQQVGVLCLLFYFFTHIPISYQYLAFLGFTGHYLFLVTPLYPVIVGSGQNLLFDCTYDDSN